MDGCHADTFALADEAAQRTAIKVVGKPSELTAELKLATIERFSHWADELESIVRAAGHGQLDALLAEWETRAQSDTEILHALTRANLHADMAGQLFVRAVEVPELDTKISLAIPDARPSFLRMPFDEAIRAFLERGVVDTALFDEMDSAAQLRSRSALAAMTGAQRERVRAELERVLREGGSFADFQRFFSSNSLGITPARPFQVETLFRTNVQMSYGSGRVRQLEHPAVLQARPFSEYRTAGDSRVRPEHEALNGMVFNRAEDSGWRQFAPPLGHNCRCSLITIRDPDESRIRNTGELTRPDPNWQGPG